MESRKEKVKCDESPIYLLGPVPAHQLSHGKARERWVSGDKPLMNKNGRLEPSEMSN